MQEIIAESTWFALGFVPWLRTIDRHVVDGEFCHWRDSCFSRAFRGRHMVAQVSCLALCLATISILVVPTTALALPIRFRVQQVESSFVLRDAPNGISDHAGGGTFNGLISLAEGSLGGGMAGAGGSMGNAYGGGTGAPSGGTRAQTRSTPRAWSSSSRGLWNSGSRYSGGGGSFDSNALVSLNISPLLVSQPTVRVVEKVPEPATVLMGAVAAFFLLRRRRRNDS
jgi:hypothetical protein